MISCKKLTRLLKELQKFERTIRNISVSLHYAGEPMTFANDMIEAYIEAVALACGEKTDNLDLTWVHWYCRETDYGRKGSREATFENGKIKIVVDRPARLLEVIRRTR